ncbi:MAG: HAMP domain-containing sensor histidine kinase [Rhodocyclaceae bacterium]|nr:HAMP domain-containing sensor histidine kinase [Rhodocyclaceae bacterium]
MRRRHSLRLRVANAFAWFGGLVSLLLATGLYFATHDLSQRLIDETLRAELDDYMARRSRNPLSIPPSTLTLRGYVVLAGAPLDPVPEAMRRLSPGRHNIELDGAPFRVAVADAQGTRYFMAFNETRQRLREQRFIAWLVGGVLIMILVSAAGGLWLAGRVIAPVTTLARQVAQASPEDPPHLAASDDGPRDELGELRRTFDAYLSRLHAFVDRERAFTADVSHELRTPLAVIQGAVELLQDDPALNDIQRTRLARMERVARDMGELIRALLLMAREENAEAHGEVSCDAAAVVRDCVERHRQLIGSRNTEVRVEIRAAPRLPVEATLLSIIVGNLVRNAFAHTEAGQVAISLDADRLDVSDTGVGIKSEEIGRVFQRYYKGAASQGQGIGLSLVKRICERYGWSISIESREGQGTAASLLFHPDVAP